VPESTDRAVAINEGHTLKILSIDPLTATIVASPLRASAIIKSLDAVQADVHSPSLRPVAALRRVASARLSRCALILLAAQRAMYQLGDMQ
jgi:hypothetical protein